MRITMIDPWKEFALVMVFVFLGLIASLIVLYKVICPAIWSV